MGIKCHYKMTYKAVKQAYKEVFREHGLPYFMHTNNGAPFGSVTALGRYTRLSYWLIEKGVIPVFSDPASPQQNGRHERMHRDLKAYCRTRMGSTLAKQQVIMEDFVQEYNNIRPHEAIKMKTPQSVHKSVQIKSPFLPQSDAPPQTNQDHPRQSPEANLNITVFSTI